MFERGLLQGKYPGHWELCCIRANDLSERNKYSKLKKNRFYLNARFRVLENSN